MSVVHYRSSQSLFLIKDTIVVRKDELIVAFERNRGTNIHLLLVAATAAAMPRGSTTRGASRQPTTQRLTNIQRFLFDGGYVNE